MECQIEKNTPMYSLIFIKIDKPNESLCFPIKCIKLEYLSDMLKIELSSRVTIPEDWILARIERYMFTNQDQDPFKSFENFTRGED